MDSFFKKEGGTERGTERNFSWFVAIDGCLSDPVQTLSGKRFILPSINFQSMILF